MRLLCEAKDRGNIHTLHVDICHHLFEGTITREEFNHQKQLVLQIVKEHKAINGFYDEKQMKAVSFFQDLYENTPDDMGLSSLQQRCADIDALHMGVRAYRMIQEKHIAPEEKDRLNEFWTYIQLKLKTTEAIVYFNELCAIKKDLPDISYQIGLTYTKLIKDALIPD